MTKSSEVWASLHYAYDGKAYTLDGKPVGSGELFGLKLTDERRLRDGLIQTKLVPIDA